MIDVKMIAKPKDGGSTSGSSSVTVVKQIKATSAQTADKAKEAEHAAQADNATNADNANLATRALSADRCDSISDDSELWDKFLRKDTEDTAAEKITFEKGADFNGESNFNALANFLAGLSIGENGTYGITSEGVATLRQLIVEAIQSTDITTDYLTVTKKAHFFEVVIDKLKSVGGTVVLTGVNCKLDLVEAYDASGNLIDESDTETEVSYWKGYWLAKDGEGNAVTNDWEAGDLAICYTNNMAEGTAYDVSAHYWWRKVEEVDDGVVSKTLNGETVEMHWMRISNTTYDSYTDNALPGDESKLRVDGTAEANPLDSDAPQAGDSVMLLGSMGDDDTRKNAIVLAASKWIDNGRAAYTNTDSATGETISHDAIKAIQCPAIIQYQGIGSFSLADCRYTYFAANGNSITGSVSIDTSKLPVYTYYAYANTLTPDDTSTPDGTQWVKGKQDGTAAWKYMGIVSNHTQGDSDLAFSDYSWSEIKGADGDFTAWNMIDGTETAATATGQYHFSFSFDWAAERTVGQTYTVRFRVVSAAGAITSVTVHPNYPRNPQTLTPDSDGYVTATFKYDAVSGDSTDLAGKLYIYGSMTNQTGADTTVTLSELMANEGSRAAVWTQYTLADMKGEQGDPGESAEQIIGVQMSNNGVIFIECDEDGNAVKDYTTYIECVLTPNTIVPTVNSVSINGTLEDFVTVEETIGSYFLLHVEVLKSQAYLLSYNKAYTITVSYTWGCTSYTISASLTFIKVKQGQTGEQGAAGNGVSSATVQYAAASIQLSDAAISALEDGTYTGVWTWQDTVGATGYSAATPYLYTMTTLLDADGNVLSRTITFSVWGKTGEQGEKGDPGDNGDDGFSFSVDQSALTFDLVALDEDDGGGYEVQYNGAALSDSNCPAVHVYAYYGTASAQSIMEDANTQKNCTASIKSNSTVSTIKLTSVSNTTVTVNDKEYTVPYSSGYVSVAYYAYKSSSDTTGKQFTVTIPFTVSGSYTSASLKVSQDSIKSQVAELTESVDGVKSSYSAIEQKADSITLKVASQQLDSRRWNLLSDGYFNAAFYGNLGQYALAKELAAGTKYTMTVMGKALNTSSRLVVYIYALDSSSSRTDSHTAIVTSTTEGMQTVTFEAAQSGQYYIYPYAYKSGTSTTGTSYQALLRWVTVEEGAVSSGAYALSEDDLWAKPNLLAGTKDWTTGDYGSAFATSLDRTVSVEDTTVKVEGRKMQQKPVLTLSTAHDVATYNGAVSSPVSKLYTLSFWAKCNSSGYEMYIGMGLYLASDGTSSCPIAGASDSEGYAVCSTGGSYDGSTSVTLSTEWKKYSVTWWMPSVPTGLTVVAARLLAKGITAHFAGVKLREGGRADAWTDYGASAATSAELASSIAITDDQIVLSSENTVFVDNNGNTVGVFTEDGLSVSELHTSDTDGSGNSIDIQNGTVTANGSNGTRFVFGFDSDGNAVLNYYGTDGTLKYSLGPNGLDASTTTSSSWTKLTYYNVSSLSMPAAGEYADGTQAKTWFNRSYTGTKKNYYRYTAARVNGNAIADKDNGFTTQEAAAAADGKIYTNTGGLGSLASDSSVYLVSGFGGYLDSTNDRYYMTVYYMSSGSAKAYRTFYCTKAMWESVNNLYSFQKATDSSVEIIS